MEHKEFTKAQWSQEMAAARANGCRVMQYQQWVEYRKTCARLFNELTA